jgi:hypothetical protein
VCSRRKANAPYGADRAKFKRPWIVHGGCWPPSEAMACQGNDSCPTAGQLERILRRCSSWVSIGACEALDRVRNTGPLAGIAATP